MLNNEPQSFKRHEPHVAREANSRFDYSKFIGSRFGNWTVLGIGEVSKTNRKLLAKCDCGVERQVFIQSLVRGKSLSCGCYSAENTKVRMAGNSIGFKREKGETALRTIYSQYRNVAYKRNLHFGLTLEEFRSITSGDCYICGAKPSNIKKNKYSTGDYVYNGVDRFDNNIGYTLENSRPCCATCNRMKNNMKFEDFKEWILRVSEVICRY